MAILKTMNFTAQDPTCLSFKKINRKKPKVESIPTKCSTPTVTPLHTHVNVRMYAAIILHTIEWQVNRVLHVHV